MPGLSRASRIPTGPGSRRIRVAVSIALAALLHAGAATASNVTAGYDLFETPLNGVVLDFGDVSAAIPGDLAALPADAFFPGSQPFTGVVEFVGEPPGSFLGQPTGNADTIVQRLADAALPGIPSSDTVPVEIVAMDLRSIASISPPGETGVWAIGITQSTLAPSTGSMTLHHTSAEGGRFGWQIDLCPSFVLVEFTPPFRNASLDYCVDVDPAGIPVTTAGQPWAHAADAPLVSPLSGPDFFPAATVTTQGPQLQIEPIEAATPPPPGSPVPALGPLAQAIGGLLVVVAAAAVRHGAGPATRSRNG